MTRGEILNVAWTVPLWLAAVYNWFSSVRCLTNARRPEYRSGEEPFILWRNACLTPDGIALRRRGTRAMFRFVLICAVAVAGAFVIDRTVGLR